jgi:CRISPR system Cascade subunit CasC
MAAGCCQWHKRPTCVGVGLRSTRPQKDWFPPAPRQWGIVHITNFTTMFIQLHIIQSLPPSNPNRGSDGAPKSAFFGGSLRTRMSSQSQKRAARLHYQRNATDRSQLAQRSRRWDIELAPLLEPWSGDDAVTVARVLLNLFNTSAEKLIPASASPMGNLLFLAQHELDCIAEIAVQHEELLNTLLGYVREYDASLAEAIAKTKPGKKPPESVTVGFTNTSKKELAPLTKEIVKRFTQAIPGDVALFGRMMSTLTETSVDGCVQVAHAISVNPLAGYAEGKVKTRDGWMAADSVDYFTACDDIEPIQDDSDQGAGAAHLGEVPFSAPVHYRYANICMSELRRLMGNDEAAKMSAAAFVRAFVTTLPDGHATSFAHQTMPEFVLIEVGPEMPYSYVNAFSTAISGPDGGGSSIPRQAAAALMQHRVSCAQMYGTALTYASVTAMPDVYSGGVPLADVIAAAIAASGEDPDALINDLLDTHSTVLTEMA